MGPRSGALEELCVWMSIYTGVSAMGAGLKLLSSGTGSSLLQQCRDRREFFCPAKKGSK